MLRREDGHVLRGALVFAVECPRWKGRLKMTWKKQVEDEGRFAQGRCTLFIMEHS